MGRPRKTPIEQTSEPESAAFPPPEPDHSTQKSLTLEMIQAYHAASPRKNQLICYLMRLYPEIDLRITNGPDCVKYIDKAEIFTREQILSVHGSGAYQISFHDESRPRNKRRVGLCILELFEPGIDPIVDLRTVLWDSPKNRPFVSRLAQLGKLPPNVLPFGVNAAGVVDKGPVVPVAPAAVPVAPGRRLVDEVRESLELVDILRPAAASAEPSESITMQVLKELRDDNRRLREQAQTGPAGPVDGLELLRNTTAILREFGWTPPGQAAAVGAVAGAVAGEPASPSAVEKYLPVIGQVVSDVRGMLELLLGKPAASSAAVEPEPQPAAASSAANQKQISEPAAVEPEPVEDAKVDMIELLKQFAQPAFAVFSSRGNAADLAREIAQHDGLQPLRLLVNMGAAKICSFLQFVPDLKERLAAAKRSEAELKRFVHDFIEAAKKEVAK